MSGWIIKIIDGFGEGIKFPFKYIRKLWLDFRYRDVLREGFELFYWYDAHQLDIIHLMTRHSIIKNLSRIMRPKYRNYKQLKICIRHIHRTFRRDFEELYEEKGYFYDTLTKRWIWEK